MDFAKLFSDYGFNGIVIGTLFFILWRMLVWVMKWVDKQSEQHEAERTLWLETINKINASIDAHNLTSIEARKTVEEAHKYQREEHKKMVEILGRINGYKKE